MPVKRPDQDTAHWVKLAGALPLFDDGKVAEIDQPYNLHKRHLLARRGMPLGLSGGAPRLKLCQVLGVGVDQPKRMGRKGIAHKLRNFGDCQGGNEGCW